MMTAADKLKRTNNNMDAVRYFMVYCVLGIHFDKIFDANIYWPFYPVGGFFTLSGFLNFHSYLRHHDVKRFLKSRARRLLPPYILVVLLCAFLLVFVSRLSPSQYFSSPDWWKYLFANLASLNFLQPSLPGVFDSPEFYISAVNGSLWTMKIEWCLCFSVPIVAALIALPRFKTERAKTIILSAIVFLSIIYTVIFIGIYRHTEKEIYSILGRQIFAQLAYFYVGVIARRHLELLLHHPWKIFIALALLAVIMQFHPLLYTAFAPIVIGGFMIWFSMIGSWGKYLSRHDNVSYDIFLFHFPIFQLGIYFGLDAWHPVAAFIFLTVITIICALLSWNLIGRPFARRKKGR